MTLAHHHAPSLRTTARSRGERGYVLAMFGLLLVPLLLMAGLAVDVGSWYNRASDIQKAADAASLAGVVWLPDEAKAREVATAVAALNGFDDADPNITVTVAQSTKAPRRLGVTIRDDRVGSFFYSELGGRDIELSRKSFAEYVTPVPMGSPRNYFGLGSLPTLGGPEYLYQSVNPYCTDKVNGDRHQSRHFGGVCSSALNTEYKPSGYEMYIDVLEGRPASMEIRLFDPRYNETDLNTVISLPPVCPSSPYVYPTSTTSGWTTPGTNSTLRTIRGPLQYQTRNNSTTNTWNTLVELPDGVTFQHRTDRLRFRSPAYTYPADNTTGWSGPASNSTVLNLTGPLQYQIRPSSTSTSWTPSPPTSLLTGNTYSRRGDWLRYRYPTYTPSVCVPQSTTEVEDGPDQRLHSGSEAFRAEDITYRLYAADDTPLDDTDNLPVTGCTRTFSLNTGFEYQYLGSRRWNTLCTIPTTAVSGKYILRVTNDTNHPNNANGSNQYGVVARYTNASGDGLCDGRTDDVCPRVYGKDAISVYANTSEGEASFFLAEIGPEHVGKKLKLELWDPGEGGSQIQILRPTATDGWTPATFDWESTGVSGSPATDQTSISVTGNRFNGRLLDITVDLTDYAPPTDNRWWKIYYEFNDPSRPNVTDRTTWSARIIGDPVHLIEEN